MQIFADHCVPSDVISALRKAGFKVERAIEAGLDKSSDQDIFNYILKTSQILLTFDRGFGNITRFDIRSSNGVVVFHIDGLKKETVIKRVISFFSKFKNSRLKGTLFVINLAGRIKPWPKIKD